MKGDKVATYKDKKLSARDQYKHKRGRQGVGERRKPGQRGRANEAGKVAIRGIAVNPARR